jgi:hypothetical protein
MLTLVPITYAQACEFVDNLHRHHRRPQGWKFGIGLQDGEKLVGVAMCGRPVARGLDNGLTLEVTRLCTDGTEHACSMLYGACRRAAKAMGYKRVVTYILENEPGTSLKAAGWTVSGEVRGREWDTPSRRRGAMLQTENKVRWEAVL